MSDEGRFVAFVPSKDSKMALEVIRSHHLGTDAAIIGKVTEDNNSLVKMRSKIRAKRILDMLSGEQLPRIC